MNNEEKKEHESDCDGVARYSDGVIRLCLCSARNCNTVLMADFKDEEGNRPAWVIQIIKDHE